VVPDTNDEEAGVGHVGRSGPARPTTWRATGEPRRTATTIRDGWLHTGDAGYIDADGYLFLHDRIKDMVVTGGENVYPTEVENVILSDPRVADAAVIGCPTRSGVRRSRPSWCAPACVAATAPSR